MSITQSKKCFKETWLRKTKYAFHAHSTSYTIPMVLVIIEQIGTWVPELLHYAYIS
jgi:hypothetical protein